MPGCSAVGCRNRSEHGYRLFLLPQGARNESRRWEWIYNIGRLDLPSRPVICEAHFTNDQFENNRLDKKRLLKWNAVPTVFDPIDNSTEVTKSPDISDDSTGVTKPLDPSDDSTGVRRSQRKRTLIKEEHLEWPPVKFPTTETNTSTSSTKIKQKRTANAEGSKKDIHKGKGSSEIIIIKSEPFDELDEPVSNRVIKRGPKGKKLFDEEGFLRDAADMELPLIVESSNEHSNDSKSCIEGVAINNSFPSGMCSVADELSVPNIELYQPASGSNEESPSFTVANDEHCDNEFNDVSVNSPTVHNLRYKGFNLLTSSTSNLEDFAEIISEEQVPRTRISILGHKKKPTVKKVVRLSTDNICRICGKLSESLLPIYSDSGKRRHVPLYIHQYLPIKVSETDSSWPKNICALCIKCLTEWDGLYSKCRQVDALFGNLLNSQSCNSLVTSLAKDSTRSGNIREEQNSILGLASSHNDHNYCPKNKSNTNPQKIATAKAEEDESDELSNINDCCLNSRDDDDRVNESTKDYASLSDSVDNHDGEIADSSEVINNKLNTNSGDEKLPESNKTNEKTNAGKQYKIGITLVKNKDCNEGAELDFSSLKSILISKVNQLFQSICTDKAFSKSLVNSKQKDDQSYNENSETSTEDEDSSLDNARKMRLTLDDDVDESETGKVYKVKSRRRQPKQSRKRGVPPDDTGSYLCSDCGSLIMDRKTFLTHRRTYHIEKKCRFCSEILPSLHDYQRHLRSKHVDKISNSCCELCGATFIRRERLQRHKLIIHNIGEYVYCNICNKKCASRQQLYCHKSDAHNKINNKCHYCGQNFASHQSFLAHLKKKHSLLKNFTCIHCDKSFTTGSNLENHMEKCQNDNHSNDEQPVKYSSKFISANKKLYTCLICSVKITDVDMLKQHMNYHANDEYIKNLIGKEEKSDYLCNLCNMYLSTEKDLALHRFFSHQEAPFVCSVLDCNMTFWKRMSLIMHQMTVHKMPSNTCKICSQSFSDFKEKRRHMKTCHSSGTSEEKPYVCTVCNRRFCWKSTLKTHMVIHSDVKMYKCHMCDKEFKLKLTLSKHMQYHQRKQLLEEEEKSRSVTEVASISEAVEEMEVETEPKQIFTVTSDEQGMTVVNTTGLLKICTVFKCPDCNILFTHKETRDSHYLEEHANQQAVNYKIEDVIDVNINESEFV